MHNLAKNLADFDKEAGNISSLYRIHIEPGVTPAIRMAALECALVQLQNVWGLSCRKLIIQSCSIDCLTIRNSIVARSSVCRTEPVEFLRLHWGRRNMNASWEPDWHVPSVSIRAATLLGNNNLGSLTVGLGAVAVADQVRFARNVVCHNLPRIWSQFNAMTLRTQFKKYRTVDDYISDLYQGTYVRVLEYWIAEFRTAFSLALA